LRIRRAAARPARGGRRRRWSRLLGLLLSLKLLDVGPVGSIGIAELADDGIADAADLFELGALLIRSLLVEDALSEEGDLRGDEAPGLLGQVLGAEILQVVGHAASVDRLVLLRHRGRRHLLELRVAELREDLFDGLLGVVQHLGLLVRLEPGRFEGVEARADLLVGLDLRGGRYQDVVGRKGSVDCAMSRR
jgi:hypothetical protein